MQHIAAMMGSQSEAKPAGLSKTIQCQDDERNIIKDSPCIFHTHCILFGVAGLLEPITVIPAGQANPSLKLLPRGNLIITTN